MVAQARNLNKIKYIKKEGTRCTLTFRHVSSLFKMSTDSSTVSKRQRCLEVEAAEGMMTFSVFLK